MGALPLAIGRVCRSGHKIETEEDLYVWVRADGTLKRRCRKCKISLDAKAPPKRKRLNMLQAGECNRGHIITSIEDVYTHKDLRGWVRMICRQCRVQRLNGHTRRYIRFDCPHEVVFSPPLPNISDLVYCVRCSNYQIVKGWGDIVRVL